MKKLIACFVVCALFGAWHQNMLCQTTRVKVQAPSQASQTVKVLQATVLKEFKPTTFSETVKYVNGMASADANSSTGEIWMVAMNNSSSGLPAVAVGFCSSPLQNTGTADWTGVTITAIFEVKSCQGPVNLSVARDSSGAYGWWGLRTCTAPGIYEVTSQPFTMKPNADYRGRVSVHLVGDSSPMNQAVSCYAKIVSVKFNFQ